MKTALLSNVVFRVRGRHMPPQDPGGRGGARNPSMGSSAGGISLGRYEEHRPTKLSLNLALSERHAAIAIQSTQFVWLRNCLGHFESF